MFSPFRMSPEMLTPPTQWNDVVVSIPWIFCGHLSDFLGKMKKGNETDAPEGRFAMSL
jgi:hypothetical protein